MTTNINVKRKKRILRGDSTPYSEVVSGLVPYMLEFNGVDEVMNLGGNLQIPSTGVYSIDIRIDTTGLSTYFTPHFGRRNTTTTASEYFYFYTLNGELRIVHSH